MKKDLKKKHQFANLKKFLLQTVVKNQ